MGAIRARSDGRPGAELELDAAEREALLGLCAELEPLLERSVRAAPPAYPDAADLEEEYRRLTGPDLLAARAAAMAAVRRTLSQAGPVSSLEPDEVESWLRACNVLRVALGEALGIREDGWEDRLDPRAHLGPPYAALHALGWIQQELIRLAAVSGPQAPG